MSFHGAPCLGTTGRTVTALQRFVGERLVLNDATYEIVGYDIADRNVTMLATSLSTPCRRIELSLPEVLRALFEERKREHS